MNLTRYIHPARVIALGLMLSSLAGYLQWGGGNSAFLVEAEWKVLSQVVDDPKAFLHPLIILPMVGQVLLLVAAIQKKPAAALIFGGMLLLALLMVMVLLAGLLGRNLLPVFSVLPFLAMSAKWIVYYRRSRSAGMAGQSRQ